jgi:RNA recognition motif-containing protein
VNDEALRRLLHKAGFIWEVKIPRGPDGRAQGFGFVAFTCKSHAEKAIALANGKLVMGRPVAVDWAVAKAQYTNVQKAAGAWPGRWGAGVLGAACLRWNGGRCCRGAVVAEGASAWGEAEPDEMKYIHTQSSIRSLARA